MTEVHNAPLKTFYLVETQTLDIRKTEIYLLMTHFTL